MKKLLKLAAAITGIALALSFAGCSNGDDGVNVLPGPGKSDTPTPVVGETMPLIINLDDSCAVPGGSVTVKYGHNQDTDTTADDKFTTTTATLNAAGTTATAYLQKSYAFGDELWFNNTEITVKNASGDEIKIDYAPGSAKYFKYNAAGHILNIIKYSSEAKLMSITFTNLGSVKAGTVTYGPSEKDEDKATLKTVDMTIAADGASATAPISPDNCNANGWIYIAEIKVYSDTAKTTAIAVDTISYATDGGKPWMDVNDMKAVTLSKDAEEIITFPYTKTVTVASEGYSKIVPANAFKDKTIAYLSVKITSETEGAWASLSGANAWGQATYQTGCINTTTNIDSADFLTAVKANGLYIDSSVGTFTVEVSYSETAMVVAEKKTFTITFDGFEIPGGSVTGLVCATAWGDNAPAWTAESAFAPTVTVAADGKSASFDVEKSKLDAEKLEFYVNLDAVKVFAKDSATEQEITTRTGGSTDGNHWYGYNDADSFTATFTYTAQQSGGNIWTQLYFTAFAGTGAFVPVVSAADMPKTITELFVALENIQGSSDWWFQINEDGSTWDNFKAEWDGNISGYSITITDSAAIAKFIAGGIYAVTGNGLSGTLTVKYR